MFSRSFLLAGLLLTTAAACRPAQAQTAPAARPLSQRMADAFISWHPDSIVIGNRKTARWDYEQGLMLKALERVWQRTGDARYFTYIQQDLDQFVRPDGSIRTYKLQDYNLDNLTTGHALLTLAQMSVPQAGKYRKAAEHLRQQLQEQPRTQAGGFWHKKVYPNQMWLDGLYMAEPFYAEYSQLFNQPAGFDDIAKQFALIEQHLRDPKTGLYYHGYDESRTQQWANKTTGQSANFWDRGLGWYAMALVDVLDYFPQNHPQRAMLVKSVQRLAPALVKYQDASTGTWALVLDQAARPGNYQEASGSSMFVYFLQKGVRLGYLDKQYAAAARRGYEGLLKQFVAEENGALAFNGTVSVGGLGGKPYRDGSFEYYLTEPLRQNDLKGVGPFILASVEMETAAERAALGPGKRVALDNYFNHELRPSPFSGQPETWHYTWADRTHGGFWLWGQQLRDLGACTTMLPTPPTAASLKGVDVYIIVDPDTKKETPNPNFVRPADVATIAKWVKAGGTLVLMANDTSNCEIPRFNTVARAFGIEFQPLNLNMVKGSQFEQGRVALPAGGPVFQTATSAYIKELAPLAVQAPAQPLVTQNGHVIMATARYGKGRVFAVGDPWLYNEYVDGRKIPASFENFQAARDLATWLLQQPGRKLGRSRLGAK